MISNQTKNPVIWLVTILLALTTLTVLPYSVTDPINLPKMSVLIPLSWIIAGVLLVQGSNLFRSSRKWISFISGAFIINLIFNLFIFNKSFGEILYGIPGRNTGVATYISYTFVMLACSFYANNYFIKRVFSLMFSVGVILLIYGFFQSKGLEPFPYVNVYENNVFGTFGNPNFQSAFLGVLSVYLFAQTINYEISLSKKIALGLMLFICLIGINLTNSIQGFFNFMLGISVVLYLYFLGRKRRTLANLTLLSILLGILSVAAAFFKAGPIADLIYKGSMGARVYYWKTAFKIALEHPFFGVGLDHYGDWLRRYRSVQEVATNLTADSSHSVYLDLLSGGGFPLFIIYLSLTTLTIVSIIKYWKRNRRFEFQYLTLVGVWVAHQAQSLISIGHIGVAIWGWAFSGLLIGYEINTRDVSSTLINVKNVKGRPLPTSQSLKILVLGFSGLIIGLLIALPPFVSAQKYYNSFKSGNGLIIKEATKSFPYNRNSYLYTISVFQRNKFNLEALNLAKESTSRFPNSFEAWRLVLDLSPEGSKNKENALKRLHFLDPNNSAFFDSNRK